MSIGVTPSPVKISVRDFLAGVFGPDLPNAWVCVTPNADSPDWKGCSASIAQLDGTGWDTQNCYYSVAVMKPGATSRKDANWSHTRVIVVDDVVEKADPSHVQLCLGEPSFIVQTSPGSQQWGYILKAPITDPAVQAQLMRAITLAFFKGIEPGHRDLTRYVRLPVGVNNKTSRVQGNGGVAPGVVCVRWNHGMTCDWRDLAMRLEGVDSALTPGKSAWQDAEGTKVISASASGVMGRYPHVTMADVDTWIARGDYILAAFRELGMLRGEQANGYYEVECPWEATHTKTDDRTGWSPERFLGNAEGFSCMHSDGALAKRKDWEVEEELRTRLDAVATAANQPTGRMDVLANVSRQTRKAQGASAFAANPPSAGQAGMLVVAQAVAHATGTAAPAEWVSYGRNAPASPIPQRRRICDGFARGEVTYITAQPAAGKSAIGCVAFPLALAADRPELVGEQDGFERAGDVYLVSNEDNADMVRKRAAGWMQKTGVTRADLRFDTVVNKVQGFVAVRKDDRYADVRIGEDLAELGKRILASDVDVCMVILDTQATVFAGINENDNSDAGACGRILTAWAKEHNVSLVIVHHMPKANGRAGGGGDQTSVRGASAFAGMMRNGVTLVQMPDDMVARLKDPRERDTWVIYEGGKANHSAKAGRRWFRKYIEPVEVEDERNPGGKAYDPVPVFLFDKNGPDFGFDPTGDEALYQITAIVCDMLRAGTGLRVNVTGTDLLKPKDYVGDQLGIPAPDADKAIKAAERAGLIEQGDGPRNPKTHKCAKVWRPTKEGGDLVEQRRAAASDMDVSGDDDCPI
jgi:RecA-family ATPase